MTSTTKAGHTPTPWRTLTFRDGSRNVVGPDSNFVCEFGHQKGNDPDRIEADGALIVRAVNSHQELVEALRDVCNDPMMAVVGSPSFERARKVLEELK